MNIEVGDWVMFKHPRDSQLRVIDDVSQVFTRHDGIVMIRTISRVDVYECDILEVRKPQTKEEQP
jgi:hypothetical protein